MAAIPTTVFSGFLGSGKTTIMTHLIDELQAAGKQVIYIKNEIGSENVDSQLMVGKHIKTKELLNGCICCTLVGPFISAINEIAETFKPDRILIEASGAADPAAIALMIDSHPKLVRDGVIAVVDVVNFEGYKDISQTARNQARFTDLIIFNKIELADLAQKQAVVGYVRELNDHSPIVEAPHGTLSSQLIFGLDHKELNELLQTFEIVSGHHVDSQHPDHTHSHHLQEDGIESTTVSFATPPSEEQLRTYVQQLPQAVFRVKGFVKLADGRILVVNKVGVRTDLQTLDSTATPPQKDNLLVLIGSRLQSIANTLQP